MDDRLSEVPVGCNGTKGTETEQNCPTPGIEQLHVVVTGIRLQSIPREQL